MGRVSSQWEEMQALHIGDIIDKSVCIKHVDDKSLKSFIRNNYESGFCDYCNKKVKVVSLEDLMNFIMNHICKFYEDAANFLGYDSREGGYQGESYTAQEIIEDHIELETDPYVLTTDIINSIEDINWASRGLHYRDTERDFLLYQWSHFKDTIKHRSRFLLHKNEPTDSIWHEPQDPQTILKEIGLLVNKLGLIKTIESNQKLFRCRQVKATEKVSDIKEMVAPPIEYAVHPNRFSPSGIPMFYAAFAKTTAYKETLDSSVSSKPFMMTGEFTTNKTINVIDFSRAPKSPSIFREITERKYYLLMFLNDLIRDIVKPIEKDGKEHIDYVPTQFVTEYFKYVFNRKQKNKIEGIIYPSSKDDKKAIVLFWDNEECIQWLSLIGIERKNIAQ